MSNNTYIAITIGPIVDTLSNTRHTRELWAASYIFSYIMKQIAAELKITDNREFIIPYIGDGNLFADCSSKPPKYKMGAGVFPDRIIFRAAEGDSRDTINKIADTELEKLGVEISNHIFSKNEEKQTQVVNFIKGYFQIDVVEMDLGDNPKPILDLSPYLNTVELQRRFPLQKEVYLITLFNWSNKSFLVKDGFCQEWYSFETILEIATKEFDTTQEFKKVKKEREKNYSNSSDVRPSDIVEMEESPLTNIDKLEDAELIKALSARYKDKEKDGKIFKPIHKYVAIVYSDGDRIGKIIEGIEKEGNHSHSEFSKQLSEFALNAVEKINAYGGMPVYAGGDDLLFFAPVVNGEDTIFSLLNDLDDKFKNLMKDFDVNVSQSFGLSISYYKHPLAEALETARKLLFVEAKNEKRNNIAFKLLKHSGAWFGTVLHIESPLYKLFTVLLKANLENEGEGLLRSVIYKLRETENLITIIGRDQNKVTNFVKNNFDESIHKREPFKTFIESLGKVIQVCFEEEDSDEKAFRKIYSILRTIAFLTQKEEK